MSDNMAMLQTRLQPISSHKYPFSDKSKHITQTTKMKFGLILPTVFSLAVLVIHGALATEPANLRFRAQDSSMEEANVESTTTTDVNAEEENRPSTRALYGLNTPGQIQYGQSDLEWQAYNSKSVYMDIYFASIGYFSPANVVYATVQGNAYHYQLTGTSAVYKLPGKTDYAEGFRIYVVHPTMDISPQMAINYDWRVNYMVLSP